MERGGTPHLPPLASIARVMSAVSDRTHPDVSVVMVIHGAWNLAEQALSRLTLHTERSFEVILVDNRSDDGTRTELSRLKNATVILNDENRGFGPASNQGADRARGEYLLLLNTDAFVHPAWLEPLVEALNDPRAAAAIPRYLNPDGSLQEAGALLARDGTVMPYGAGDDPELPCYRFRRTVDYGSAACMLIRRTRFMRLGGFDERYAPAYFEDVDLCLRLAHDGAAVVYEPRSTVTHVLHGSGAPAEAVRLSERHHQLFVKLRGHQLAGRPWTLVNASNQAVIAARDALATPRLLICGGSVEPATARIVEALLDGWPRARITWLTNRSLLADADVAAWSDRGIEVLGDQHSRWLGARLFHYDLVFADAKADPDLRTAIENTQPQTRTVALEDLHHSRALAEHLVILLAGAGIAPQRRRTDVRDAPRRI